MHALVVRVTFNDFDAALRELREQIIPQVSQAPGFVTGYWTSKDNTGLAMVVFEAEDQAREVGKLARRPTPAVNVEDVEVRVVDGHA